MIITKQTKVYQAIHIKWFGPSAHKPSRYKARSGPGSIWVSKDHGLSTEQNIRVVAAEYCRRKEWAYDELYLGQLYDGSYVAVLLHE